VACRLQRLLRGLCSLAQAVNQRFDLRLNVGGDAIEIAEHSIELLDRVAEFRPAVTVSM